MSALPMNGRGPAHAARHACLVVAAFTLLFTWLYATPILEGSLVAESDMYEQFLPVFLSPITTWSIFEFGGTPAFADPQDTAFYPAHFLFARLIGSWTGFIVAAFVLVSCFTYAYVYAITRSWVAAALAGLAFGLSEAMIERLAHVTTLHAVAWLPLMLLCIDRLREQRSVLWVATGAFAVASCILGGHPQVVIYIMYTCGAYALVGGLAERAGAAAWVRLSAALALGVLLTAVKAIPVLETAALTARQSLDFAGFVSHSNTPAQMLSGLFPTVEHEGREAPTYVGLATLLFAIVGVGSTFRQWRVAFWVGVVIVAALVGMGDATPAARFIYELPLYDRFRVGARHLILACFGLCVLSGVGLAAVTSEQGRQRRLRWAGGVLATLVAAAGTVLLSSPDTFGVGEPAMALWSQTCFLAAAVIAAAGLSRWPRSLLWVATLGVVVTCDLLMAQPHPVGLAGLDWPRIPGESAQPSIHARRLAAEMEPEGQRLLAPAGTQLDAVVPAAFARVWRIPIAGGYGPMLLSRYNTLAMMGTNGSVDLLTLADDNAALDLLGVKFVVMREEDLAPSPRFERDGLAWASRPISIAAGPRECGQRHPRSTAYALPAAVDVATIALVGRLRCSEDVPQGTEVARLRLIGTDGRTYERPLAAGVDLAEGALADPTLRQRARHGTTRVFETSPGSPPLLNYLVRLDLPSPVRANTLRIDVTGTPGWLDIERLTVVDSNGTSLPVEAPGLLLDPHRWRERERFSTSRTSDRRQDDDDAGETREIVFENQRARPRAWIATEVVPLDDKDMSTAVHHSLLPDGRRFEPARMALVSPGVLPAATYPGSAASATMHAAADGAFSVEVTSDGGGLLILGESYYPGWRARIDRQPATVYPANMSQQAVPVPAGRHRVEFELVSDTLRAGVATSMGALGLLIACTVWGTISLRRPRS